MIKWTDIVGGHYFRFRHVGIFRIFFMRLLPLRAIITCSALPKFFNAYLRAMLLVERDDRKGNR